MINQNEERLQKVLARAGIASRRACEDLIVAGRVKVNGKTVTQLGTKINPGHDRVTVDDEPIGIRPSAAPQKIYLMLNKPPGYLSTVTDPQGRPTVMDLLGEEQTGRLYPVGRLDADSEGLILLTNDGAFANTMSHPRYEVEKEYVALLDGIIAMKDIETLRSGVPIRVEDPETGEHSNHQTRPAKVDLIRHEGSNSLVRFILKEGKKRQIRLMAEAVEHPVVELKRVRLGLIRLGDLAVGKYRPLSKLEVHALVESVRQKADNATTTTMPPRPGTGRAGVAGRPGQAASVNPDQARPGRGGPRPGPGRPRSDRSEKAGPPEGRPPSRHSRRPDDRLVERPSERSVEDQGRRRPGPPSDGRRSGTGPARVPQERSGGGGRGRTGPDSNRGRGGRG